MRRILSLLLLALSAADALAGGWSNATNSPTAITPRGPKGDRGCSILVVSGAPTPQQGADCDTAFDPASGRLYTKSAGVWSSGEPIGPVESARVFAERARGSEVIAAAARTASQSSATAAAASAAQAAQAAATVAFGARTNQAATWTAAQSFASGATAAQPATTDNSERLVSSSWVKTLLPGLRASVPGYGTQGMYWPNGCTALSNCGWTLRWDVAEAAMANRSTLSIRRVETYSGGDINTRGASVVMHTDTAQNGIVPHRVLNVLLRNNTSAESADGGDDISAQHVATATVAEIMSGYAKSRTWALWSPIYDREGLPNPTKTRAGAEIDYFGEPMAGTDDNESRMALIIGVGANHVRPNGAPPGPYITPGTNLEVFSAQRFHFTGGTRTKNAIYFYDCSSCGVGAGFVDNYIGDWSGNVLLRADGTMRLSSPTRDTLLELSRRTEGNAWLRLDKPAGSFSEAAVAFSRAGSLRWRIGESSDVEGVGVANSGTDFVLSRFADNGSTLGVVLDCNRVNGFCGFGGVVTPAYVIDATGQINASAGFRSGGTAGLSVTRTIRAGGGASDCTLVITGGLVTGGTCS